jgi:2-polyprenyl-6-methoxyphenol hydroxylase-like FAD-dependent oxidoreductase
MSKSKIRRALIVGGGPGGMASSIALARAGVECEVVEINDDWRPAGLGIGLQSPPLRALKTLDLFDEVVARGWPHQSIHMLSADGSPIRELPQVNVNDERDPPFITMSRMTLHEILADSMRRLGVTVRTGTSVRRLSDRGDAVDVALTDGTEDEWDLVVGADGLHSQLRGMILPDAPDPSYAGQVIWRVGARRPALLEHYVMMVGDGTRVGLVPLSDDDVYLWMLDSTLPPERPPRERLHDLFVDRLEAYGFVAPDILEQITDTTPIDFRALHWLLMPTPWHRNRALILGDAAHTSTPHLSFGVGLAFEDAVVLGELVADGAEGDELGRRFAARRFERSRLVVENSLALSRLEQDPGAPMAEHGRVSAETLIEMVEPV